MLTRIVVIRHAKPSNEGFSDDDIRPLSEEGMSIQRAFTEFLKEQGVTPSIIYTSPLLRAKQTAEVIGDVYGDVPIEIVDWLGNAFNDQTALAEMPSPKDNKTIFFVGHAPTLSGFVNKLVGEEVVKAGLANSSAVIVDFRQNPDFGLGEFFGYYQP